MRTILTVALLSMITLAGCLSSDADGETPTPAEYSGFGTPEVDAQETVNLLEEFVTTYPARVANNEDHVGSRDWLAAQYEDAGLEVYRQEFTDGIDQENILGILWGEVPYTWVIVGGHYDVYTKDCGTGKDLSEANDGQTEPDATCANRATTQGAYDDGSGTIQTLMLAKEYAAMSKETGIKPYYTMVFAAFDGEERGLQGSHAVAGAIIGECEDDLADECEPRYNPFPWNDGNIEVAGMLDLDMAGINWPGTEVPLYFDSNSNATRERADTTRKEMGLPDDMILYQGIKLGRSDYHWFYQMGVPTAFMISSFEEFQAPGGATTVTQPVDDETCTAANEARDEIPEESPTKPGKPCNNFAYPFWHAEDTMETMTFMAGDEAALVAGFQTVLDLAADTLHLFALEPTEDIDSVIIG